jgi:hypothetical protein
MWISGRRAVRPDRMFYREQRRLRLARAPRTAGVRAAPWGRKRLVWTTVVIAAMIVLIVVFIRVFRGS